MAFLQNEQKAAKLINFKIKEKDGSSRDGNALDEFILVVKNLNIPIEKVFVNSMRNQYFLICQRL